MTYDNSKGTVLEIQGSYYNVKLEDGMHVPNAQNASSVDIAVGDKVVISYVDSLHSPIITGVYDKTAGISKDELKRCILEVKQQLVEQDHPVGSPYFTFLKDDDPNERYPGTTWVLLEEDTYLVSAGANRVGASPVGSNTQSVRIDYQHTHTQNAHTHGMFTDLSGYTVTRPASKHELRSNIGGVNPLIWYTTSATNRHTGQPLTDVTATNQNNGAMTSATQTIDNKPKSIAIYMWRRTA